MTARVYFCFPCHGYVPETFVLRRLRRLNKLMYNVYQFRLSGRCCAPDDTTFVYHPQKPQPDRYKLPAIRINGQMNDAMPATIAFSTVRYKQLPSKFLGTATQFWQLINLEGLRAARLETHQIDILFNAFLGHQRPQARKKMPGSTWQYTLWRSGLKPLHPSTPSTHRIRHPKLL